MPTDRRIIAKSFYGVLNQNIGGNTKLPQHKPQSYRAERRNNKSTAETKEGLNPQFNVLHSFQRSYNAKESMKGQINSRDILPQKQIDGPGNTNAAR